VDPDPDSGRLSGSVLDSDSIQSVDPDSGSESMRTKMAHKVGEIKKFHGLKT
jgi:hypothetical protein